MNNLQFVFFILGIGCWKWCSIAKSNFRIKWS